jgi:hypothetical protein
VRARARPSTHDSRRAFARAARGRQLSPRVCVGAARIPLIGANRPGSLEVEVSSLVNCVRTRVFAIYGRVPLCAVCAHGVTCRWRPSARSGSMREDGWCRSRSSMRKARHAGPGASLDRARPARAAELALLPTISSTVTRDGRAGGRCACAACETSSRSTSRRRGGAQTAPRRTLAPSATRP